MRIAVHTSYVVQYVVLYAHDDRHTLASTHTVYFSRVLVNVKKKNGK